MKRFLLILAVAGVALVLFGNTAEATCWRGGCSSCCVPVCDPCCDPCGDACGSSCGVSSCCGVYSSGYRGHHGYRAAYRPTRFYYATSYRRSYGGCQSCAW